MYRFQVSAHTKPGESIALVGSTSQLGAWDISRGIPLQTSADRYPLWSVDLDLAPGTEQTLEYKYVRLQDQGAGEWEAWGWNRWVPLEPDFLQPSSLTIVVDSGQFGQIQPWPYGYPLEPIAPVRLPLGPEGLKIVVLGSSVAMGCSAWMLRGWADRLAQTLHERHGHRLVNCSVLGATVATLIDRWPGVLAAEQPDIVIVALSLGNEGLAYCPAHQRRAVQRRFESGLQQLVKLIRDSGAQPILGAVYPHGDYSPEHHWLLRDTHERMLRWDVPILDWLGVLDDGAGRWQPGLGLDVAHPNTEGQRRMYEAIDLSLFATSRSQLLQTRSQPQVPSEQPVFQDEWGFQVWVNTADKRVRLINPTVNAYTIAPDWELLQSALRSQAGLLPGIYIAKSTDPNAPSVAPTASFTVGERGAIATCVEVPPGSEFEYQPTFSLFAPKASQVLFYDGHLALLKEDELHLRVLNESDTEYNIHPMWREVRGVLKALRPGVYNDPLAPDAPFRTLMIGPQGLESRVKAAPHTAMVLRYQGPLSEISRVAILPLGDRCAVRMMLYKMEYDGPAFPFDLTRTTKLADIADMINTGFDDMWNPALLDYNAHEKRIYHRKWSGLSFAHEVEDDEDPTHNMGPIYARMYSRYSSRAARFWYTVNHADKLLFVRTGGTDRGSVIDLVEKLKEKCQGKPFHLLILSPQPSEDFADLPHVLHQNAYFNPDHMYADQGHWMYCTTIFRTILESLGVSSQNLFWCPPQV